MVEKPKEFLSGSSVDRTVCLREDICRGLIVGNHNAYFVNYTCVSFLCAVEQT